MTFNQQRFRTVWQHWRLQAYHLAQRLMAPLLAVQSRQKTSQVLAAWGIEQFKVHQIGMGASQANQIVDTTDGRFILRNMGSNHHYAQFQLQIMRHLTNSNFGYDTPCLQPTQTGTDYIVYQNDIWVLYEYIFGKPLQADGEVSFARQRGHLCAQLYCALRTLPLTDPNEYALPLFKDTDRVNDTMTATKSDILSQKMPTLFEQRFLDNCDHLLVAYNAVAMANRASILALEKVPVYNDWHGNNLLVRDGRIGGLIDFDSVTTAPRILDFQNAALYAASTGTGINSDALIQFAQGYTAVSPLSPAELTNIYPLMILETTNLLGKVLSERTAQNKAFLDDFCAYLLESLIWLVTREQEVKACLVQGVSG